MITEEQAIAIAEELLETEIRPWIAEEVVLVTSATVRTEAFWVFFFNSRVFIETGALSHTLVGNGPIVVAVQDGAVTQLGTASPWQEQV